MSEDEFWESTAAKVFTLSDKRDYYDERRDFFMAFTASVVFNANRGEGVRAMNPRDLLNSYYRERNDYGFSHNPDLGAITDENLTAMFEYRGKKNRGKRS